MTNHQHVIVVGGGISGLATACLLARDGHDVTLLERSAEFGGRAGVWKRDGFTFDTGPSWFLMPEVFEHFYRMMGTTTAEQYRLVSLYPGYRVFAEPDSSDAAQSVDVVADVGTTASLFERHEPGAGLAVRRYLASATRTYHAAVSAFLYNPNSRIRGFLTRQTLSVAPRLLPLLTRSLWQYVSPRFKNTLLRQILAYPAVFLGTSPFAAPALYHLMSHLDLVDGVRYPMGGFTRVIESMVEIAIGAGVKLERNAEVTAISSHDGRVSSVTFSQDGESRTVASDIVVSAVDEHHTETKLLQPEDRTYAASRWKKQVTGPSAVLIMLGVSGSLPELPHHSLFFTHDWHENFEAIFGDDARVPEPASLYVCKPSATDAVAPPGTEALFVLVPIPADVTIGHGGVEGNEDPRVKSIADLAISQIAAWAKIPDLASRVLVRKTVGPADFARDFHSFRGSALGPSHTLRQSAFLRGVTRSRRVAGLYYAGATTVPGVGLPMCLISAELVLKHVRGDMSAGPSEEP